MIPRAIYQLLFILQTSASSTVLDSAQRKSLDADSEKWFHLLVGSTVVVGIGLLFEYPEVKHEWQIWWRNRPSKTKWLVPKPDRNRIPLWSMIGFILVMGGVAAEGIFEGCMGIADTELRNFDKQVIADTELKAKTLDNSTQQLKTAAEIAKGQAESEHLARVKIEARVSWRHLNAKEESELAAKLGKFPPQSEGATFWYNAGDIEAKSFADDIASAMKLTGAVVQPPSDTMSFHETAKFGEPIKRFSEVGVYVLPTNDPASEQLANRLIKELNGRGFDCKRQDSPPFANDSRNRKLVQVVVNPRPEGPQGEYKLQAEREAKQSKSTNPK